MKPLDMLHYVDHTQLKAFASWEDIQSLCEEAIRYQTASVCIPPSYIARVHEKYGDAVNICTVVGFPLDGGQGRGNKQSAGRRSQ